ncbi:hypothetical protein DL766_003939 [Monosporascus sp. MC13-8B]|uniref:Non-haem dioxygenase N-terminal domain-containing protein n=1 Tax=Monosporascus cannonballus TaxID=155416 RepID=A0ABY0HHG3_9PEZI|nr:hypothetical protein DL762_001005 [Monosporascus cannonballus]RYP00075.1 hypothetical protein DL763_001004 [Monosporascus cannonballus]RYP32523.1 hypothetical protein DL766_003939 [Monosporascus sp. MC13-8B]
MSTTTLELRTALGPVYWDVLPNPPWNCTPEEIPIQRAVVNNGFFYVKNHGIPAELIARSKQQVLNFMRQPQEQKDLLDSRKHSKYYNGYHGYRKRKSRPAKALARLLGVFVLSLELTGDHWNDKVTYPGADGVFIYYPPRNEEEIKKDSAGLGSHTDLQLFTLLWQDHVGGLQILIEEGCHNGLKIEREGFLKREDAAKLLALSAPVVSG